MQKVMFHFGCQQYDHILNHNSKFRSNFLNTLPLNVSDIELEDSMLATLSEKITSKGELRYLIGNGLELDSTRIKRILHEHPADLTTAAFHALTEWRAAQGCNKRAYRKLRNALIDCNLEGHIKTALTPKNKQ